MKTIATYFFILLLWQIVKLRSTIIFWKFIINVWVKKSHIKTFGKIRRTEGKPTKNFLDTITVD